MEIEMKKFKARQSKMWAKIRQEREGLEIQKDKVICLMKAWKFPNLAIVQA